MDDEGAAAGEPGADEDELFRRLTEMLSPQHNPPASVTELAKQRRMECSGCTQSIDA